MCPMTWLFFSHLGHQADSEESVCQLLSRHTWEDPNKCWSVSGVSSCSSHFESQLRCWVTPTSWTPLILAPRTEQFRTSWWDQWSFLFRELTKLLRYSVIIVAQCSQLNVVVWVKSRLFDLIFLKNISRFG